MIQDELTKLADEGDDEEDDANAVKDEMQASSCQGAETWKTCLPHIHVV